MNTKMTIKPDKDDAIKRLEECKVTDADIEVIIQCKKLQELCWYIHHHKFPIGYKMIPLDGDVNMVFNMTFEQMIAVIGDRFLELHVARCIIESEVTIWNKDGSVQYITAPTARQALSMACEFVLGGKDLRGNNE